MTCEDCECPLWAKIVLVILAAMFFTTITIIILTMDKYKDLSKDCIDTLESCVDELTTCEELLNPRCLTRISRPMLRIDWKAIPEDAVIHNATIVIREKEGYHP